jgi:diguanylate cyclase (GGDEF)-like protein/PAS domain S-box-containing protein
MDELTAPDDAREETAEDLRVENERLTEFLYLVPVGLAQVDALGDVALMNSTGAQLLMPLADGPALTNLFDLLDPYAPELRNLVRQHTAPSGVICEGRRIDLASVGRGRARRPMHLAVGLMRIDAERVMAVVQDISHTVEQERALFADQQRFRAIYEGMRDSMICTLGRDERVNSWNESGERLFGYDLSEIAGSPLEKLVVHEGERQPIERARQSGWSELEGWTTRKDGMRFWGEGVVAMLYDEQGAISGYSVVLRDRSERKLARDKLLELATTDALTGLSNRRTFYDQGDREIVRRARYKSSLSVLMIDADRFKSVNDTHGHAAGDEVLRNLASVLKSTVRATDLPARYGGEEFVVLLPETAAPEAILVAERIRAAVEASNVQIDDKIIRYTISIGVSEAGGATSDLKTLLAAADSALYRAKNEGRNRVVA